MVLLVLQGRPLRSNYAFLALVLLLPIISVLGDLKLATGGNSACSLGCNGQLGCWGDNSFSQFGVSAQGRTYIAAATPPQANDIDLSTTVQVGVGTRHWCALLETQELFCQGDNSFGQLGQGSTDISIKSGFVRVSPGFRSIATGDATNCGILVNNSVACWGESFLPVPVVVDTTSAISDELSIASHQGALVLSGTSKSIVLRGKNNFGQVGVPDTPFVLSFTKLSDLADQGHEGVAVGAGGHSCVKLFGGRLACFGNNNHGQLGLGVFNDTPTFIPSIIPNVSDVDQVALGRDFTCFTTKQTAKLFCFGSNAHGQLGTGDQKDSPVPQEVKLDDGRFSVSKIFLGDSHGFAVMQGGAVFAWGRNDQQQLGFGADTFPDNVTVPLLHEALTECSQNDASFPTGFTVMLSLLVATFIGGIAFQVSEWQKRSIAPEKGKLRSLQNQIKELLRGKVDRTLLQTFKLDMVAFTDNDYQEYSSVNEDRKNALWAKYIDLLAIKTANTYTQVTRADSKSEIDTAVWYVAILLMGLFLEGPKQRPEEDYQAAKGEEHPQLPLNAGDWQKADLDKLEKIMKIVEQMLDGPGKDKKSRSSVGKHQKLYEIRDIIADMECLDLRPLVFSDLSCPTEDGVDYGSEVAFSPTNQEQAKPSTIPEQETTEEDPSMNDLNPNASATTQDMVDQQRRRQHRQPPPSSTTAKNKPRWNGSKSKRLDTTDDSSGVDDRSTVVDEDDEASSSYYVSDGPQGPAKATSASSMKRKQQPALRSASPRDVAAGAEVSSFRSSQSSSTRPAGQQKNQTATTVRRNETDISTTSVSTQKLSRLRYPTIRSILDESGPQSRLWGTSGYRFVRTEKRLRASMPLKMKKAAAQLANVVSVRGPNAAQQNSKWARLRSGCVYMFKTYFGRCRTHPGFYLWNLVMIIAIFSFFTFANPKTIESASFSLNQPQAERPGGFGVTFLPLPPYYDFTQPKQSEWIPVLYGVMHCNLFFLGMLIVPFWRRFWQTIVDKWPGSRRYLPLDDLVFIHRFYAWLFLAGLVIGCIIFLAVMGDECRDGQFVACTAFSLNDPSPITNVFALRIVVWCTVFPVMPLMYVVRRGPPSFLPVVIAQYWYEICYVLHVVIALLVVLLALIARFQVFYPVLVSWIPFILDFFYDSWRHTSNFKIQEIKGYGPDAVRNPKSFSVKINVGKKQEFSAGQYVWIRVNQVERFGVAHPFSIASAKESETLDLHIGCIRSPGKTWTSQLYSTWMEQVRPGTTPSLDVQVRGPFGCAFKSCFDPKWAGCMVIGAGTGLTAAESVLREKIQNAIHNKGSAPNQLFWFVWSTRSVDDLLMAWDVLIEAFSQGVKGGALDIDSLGAVDGSILDWIGVTLFVTDFKSSDMSDFNYYLKTEYEVEYERALEDIALDDESDSNGVATTLPSFAELQRQKKSTLDPEMAVPPERPARLTPKSTTTLDEEDQFGQSVTKSDRYKDLVLRYRLTKFLMNQIVQGAMDEKRTHIASLLRHVKRVMEMHPARRTNLCVSYCGPSSLADVIHNAVLDECHTDEVEFAMDHQ